MSVSKQVIPRTVIVGLPDSLAEHYRKSETTTDCRTRDREFARLSAHTQFATEWLVQEAKIVCECTDRYFVNQRSAVMIGQYHRLPLDDQFRGVFGTRRVLLTNSMDERAA